MYHVEHWAAWILAGLAVALGVVGLLRGFGVIEGIDTDTAGLTADPVGQFIQDGLVWLLAGISAAVLSFALHANDHHRSRHSATGYSEGHVTGEGALWATEHLFAMLMAIAAFGLGLFGVLVAFDVFDRGNDQVDGMLYLLASIGASILTVTLHAVRHHQVATDEDYIIAIVEERVRTVPSGTATPPPVETEPSPRRPYA
jgi:hypothetical protein